MDLTPFFTYGLPVLTVLAVGLVGSTRRIGFWLAILITVLLIPLLTIFAPIGGFVVALISGPSKRERKKAVKKAEQTA
ncbi:hypothetical protein [Chondromyces apiculatus]|uniref:Uncharacterized protein n=1 Tax=Chondromyces apiculatus DSM 436 TaxID=1192034 RepID=A0A017T592_9BACT|nr:hypothetical protein [Chondromyces apiculatus]EYF04404.1 Hypothetical protein CAP_4543 [Chondromyces apiculatus DSM 436]